MEDEPRVEKRFDQRQWDAMVLAIAVTALFWLFVRHIRLASRLVDGTRWFLLDDDMMISMRYARNLAEGHGLVWNQGERVEGYTNFLWTLVMSGVHVLPVHEAHTAVAMKMIGFALVGGTLWLSLRMLRAFAPRGYLAPIALFVATVSCLDVLHWAAWGFETSLLSFLVIAFLTSLIEGKRELWGYLALSLVPLTRSDALHVWIGCAAAALIVARSRRTAVLLCAALVPFVLHVAFRRSYYGEWLPNTYYLKLHELDGRYTRGFFYARNFVVRYVVLLCFGAGSTIALVRSDPRVLAPVAVVLASLAYVVTTGGDMFGNFRFLAHVMPLLFVLAAVGATKVARSRIGTAVWGGVLVVTTIPLVNTWNVLVLLDGNGDPYDQLEVAMLIRKNARRESTVAVIPAGIVPYFTRLRAIDVIGKSDKHVARLTPFPAAMVGHGKLDPAYTLEKKPDLVVSCRSNAFANGLTAGTRNADVVLSFLASREFQQDYRPYPISEAFLLGRTAIYTHPGSPESTKRTWESVEVAP